MYKAKKRTCDFCYFCGYVTENENLIEGILCNECYKCGPHRLEAIKKERDSHEKEYQERWKHIET